MILDGIQEKLYNPQIEKFNQIKDYKNGYMVRFADDMAITARTKEDAENFKKILEDFVGERGLKLSSKKTKIVNIKEGFNFLSRYYVKTHNQIHVIPSEKAVDALKESLKDLILNPEEYWTQRSLIQSINLKLHGWATYHRVEEAEDIFKEIDVYVNALLLQLMKKTYPNKTIKEIEKRFWYTRPDGTEVYALTSDRSFAVINLSDIVLTKQKRMNLSKNIFLDKDYFEEKKETREIDKISGIYKSVWQRQNGRCYFCGKIINKYQDKSIIYKTYSKINKIEDMAYVHTYCKDDELLYLDTDIVHIDNKNVKDILKDVKSAPEKIENTKWKFRGLEDYFRDTTKTPITLKFQEIEKILGFNLCKSAYKFATYWYTDKKGSISNAWSKQGYELLKIDIKNQKAIFKRAPRKSAKADIPKVILSNKLPLSAKYEIEEFCKYIVKKYGLSGKK